MPFKPEQYDSGKLVLLPGLASAAIVKGNALVTSSGYYTNATAGNGTAITHVAMETKTIGSSSGELFNAIRVSYVIFEADTTANPAATQVGTYVDLVTNAGTLDTSASTDDLFYVEKIVGALGDKKVLGWFVPSAPNVE